MLEQHCLFPKLRNVADKSRQELTGEANKETRKPLLDQATAISQADPAADARARLAAFAQIWQARAPQTVATLTPIYRPLYTS